MADGEILRRAQEHNRGSVAIPLAHEEIVGKFRENAKGSLTDRSAERVVETCMALGAGATAADLIETCIAGTPDGTAAGPPTARSL